MKPLVIVGAVFIAFIGLARPVNGQIRGAVDVQVTVLGHASAVAGGPSDHFLTFDNPVGIPGVGLSPGQYIFRFVAPSVLQVLNHDSSAIYAMLQVQSTTRSDVTDGYVVTLRKIRADAPARIVTLFLPEASTGYELIYPKIEGAGDN